MRGQEWHGKFAVFHLDRDPERKFAQIRTDGLVPCLRAGGSCGTTCVVSLGERPAKIRRLLHSVEACRLQGMSPSVVPAGFSRRRVFRGMGNAMTVPVVGAVLSAVLRRALPQLGGEGRSRGQGRGSSGGQSPRGERGGGQSPHPAVDRGRRGRESRSRSRTRRGRASKTNDILARSRCVSSRARTHLRSALPCLHRQ